MNNFQSANDGFDVIIISPKAGGVGITLTAANHIIHMERWWNPAVEDQCNDRTYRIGQKNDVHIYTPVAMHPQLRERSFDLVLDSILESKRKLAKSLLVPAEISPEDIGEGLFGGAKPKRSFRTLSEADLYEIETGAEFEGYIADLLRYHGFKVSLTPRSWDKGCDLSARLGDQRILIQCKQVMSDITLRRGVDEVIAAQSYYADATRLALVTNAKTVSRSQLALASQSKVAVATMQDLCLNEGNGLVNLLS